LPTEDDSDSSYSSRGDKQKGSLSIISFQEPSRTTAPCPRMTPYGRPGARALFEARKREYITIIIARKSTQTAICNIYSQLHKYWDIDTILTFLVGQFDGLALHFVLCACAKTTGRMVCR
uniref:Uncharacterized protein n=1 Tax=Pundamilia nyererei TaxID=303518 RepID=A0A3B4EWD0_9CICH